MISYCVALMNRGPHFQNMYASLHDGILKGDQLLVCDFGSDDIALDDYQCDVIRRPLPFRAPVAYNQLAELAKYELMCFVDADMIFPPGYSEQCAASVCIGQAMFPVCYSLHQNKPAIVADGNGWWRTTGYGNCCFHRHDFFRIGKFGEHFDRCEHYDEDIHARAIDAGITLVRGHIRGLYHQWHPNDRKWKERYHRCRPQVSE